MQFTHKTSLKGEVSIPGDKSISHRSIMFGSIANGITEITNFLQGADCLSTIGCFQKMGVDIELLKKPDTSTLSGNSSIDRVLVHGKGLHGLRMPLSVLDAGNSGTTTRLISGILSAQPFDTTLTGDASIRKRPMNRIIDPLSMMGADIQSETGNGCAPLHIHGTQLHGIHYQSKVASAQVKSAILLAGLYADSETSVTEPVLSRNHSELMLASFGSDVTSLGTTVTIKPALELHGQKISVPGDISSAAYFIAAGLLVPDSEVLIRSVGINPTRDGILRVVKDMGGDITLLNEHLESGEPVADLLVRSSALHATTIEGAIIPALIDELPMIAVMAAAAEGTTIIQDAQELKVKESNRIDVCVANLQAMGVDIEGTDDGMIIHGGKPLHGAVIDSHLDHRIAMSFTVAAFLAEGETTIKDADCVNISYPGFYQDMASLYS